MPGSAAPQPPDPTSVTAWAEGLRRPPLISRTPWGEGMSRKPLGEDYGLTGGKFRQADDESVRRRMMAAGRPEWEHYKDSEGVGTTPATVLGASDLLAPDVDPGLVFGQMTAFGPNFEVLVYDDPVSGPVKTSMAEYFANESGAYLEEEGFYDQRGYGYTNRGTPPNPTISSSIDRSPADISLVPTSSTYPQRPRTVAAGYDRTRRVLTTVFRDGTFYNYYGVSGLEWSNFKRARSKGRFILQYLDGKVRGPASMGGISQTHQEFLYKVARTTQAAKGGYQSGQKIGSKRGGKGAYSGNNSTARARRKYRARAARVFGGASP